MLGQAYHAGGDIQARRPCRVICRRSKDSESSYDGCLALKRWAIIFRARGACGFGKTR